jgi:hypothetical protein
VRLWKARVDGLLLFRERKAYLAGIRAALAAADNARAVLAGVVRRIERG